MHEHSTAKMRKYRRMKFFCIISACPAGARKWHISYFAMLLHSKKTPPKREERNPAVRPVETRKHTLWLFRCYAALSELFFVQAK